MNASLGLAACLGVAACGGIEGSAQGVFSSTEHHVMRVTVEPGSEVTSCQRIALGGGEALNVTRLEHVFDARSHHFFVYESEVSGDELDAAPFRCDDAHDLQKSALLYASQKQQDALVFPDGAAYEIAADRTLLVEWHIVNPSVETIEATATLDIVVTTEQPVMQVGMLAYYHPFIHVPPFGSSSAQMRCRLPEDITLMWTSAHMHERGVAHRAQLERIDGSSESVSVADGWQDGELHWLGGVPAARGDAISYRCDYANPSDRAVIEGPTARDHEMCMFFAGYYPRMPVEGADTCSGALSGPVFSGSESCEQVYACLVQALDPVSTEACWGLASEASTAPLLDFAYRCALVHCGESCDLDRYDQACTTCLERECATERAACAEAPP